MLCCIALQRDVMCDTMFSVVMHRVLSAMGYCVVRFDDMSRIGKWSTMGDGIL